VDIEAKDHQDYLLRTAASINTFPGFIALYSEGRDEDEEEEKSTLPPLVKGELLKLLGLFPEQRFTQPPPRFTEATLVRRWSSTASAARALMHHHFYDSGT